MLTRLEPTECETLFPCGICDACTVEAAGAALIVSEDVEEMRVEYEVPAVEELAEVRA